MQLTKLKKEQFLQEEMCLGERTVKYRMLCGVSYVENPVCPEHQN